MFRGGILETAIRFSVKHDGRIMPRMIISTFWNFSSVHACNLAKNDASSRDVSWDWCEAYKFSGSSCGKRTRGRPAASGKGTLEHAFSRMLEE